MNIEQRFCLAYKRLHLKLLNFEGEVLPNTQALFNQLLCPSRSTLGSQDSFIFYPQIIGTALLRPMW